MKPAKRSSSKAHPLRGAIIASEEGLTRREEVPAASLAIETAIYDNGRLLAVGENGALLTLDLADAPKSVLPRVVANDNWSSEISLFNPTAETLSAELVAVTAEGERAETTVELPPLAPLSSPAAVWFPGMNGYSLYIYADTDVYATSLLYGTMTESGRSPAQSAGPMGERLTNALLSGFLPAEDTPAVVLSSPGAADNVRVAPATRTFSARERGSPRPPILFQRESRGRPGPPLLFNAK
ncbi:MAG: hypothetical protein QNK37_02000 [Acidobacteriota bacterium]|nr:hypothetical protein [Acidobacteriota bacterium]